ncbi:retrovirus-related pol polyprotein from transposon TNT 1-94 [Tanacetum coccineum]
MNDEVAQNTIDKQCAEIVKKNLLIENENLIANCLSNQLLYDVEKSRCLDLEAEMSKVHNESKHILKLEREYLNLQLKYQHLQESFDNNKSQTLQEASDITSFFKIKNLEHQIQEKDNITRAHTSEKTSTMLNEIESLKAQLRSKVSCFTSDSVKPKVLAPGMYAIDVKPIPHPLKNNRSAHLNYISHLKESVETVREIVEEARVVKPLDNALNYACQYTKLSQELLEYVIGTCPKSFNERDNKAPSTPVTRKKQVTFSDKPGTSSSNTQKHEVHQKVQQTNIPVIPSTGVNTSTEASGSKPRSNTKKNRILPAKRENKKKVEDHLRTNKTQGLSKHKTRNRSKLTDIVEKFIRIVRFGNDHFGAIMGYGDYVIGDSVISRVYNVEGLGHNLFSVGQFCDFDLKIAFRKHSCFVRDMNGVDLLKGSRSTNLYTISIDDIMKSSLVCLLSKASKTKSWLWHRRLNHLNFSTINDITRKDLVRGLPRLKFEKYHLCSAFQLGKGKKYSYKPKSENTNMEVLYTLHMDLYGPMRVQSINGKKYILVIVDDYSRFTWVKFLRSKDETSEFVFNFLKQIQVGLNKTVRYIRTDNGTEFVNQVMSKYYEGVGIFHQKSVLRNPQQNGVVKRQNHTLMEAACLLRKALDITPVDPTHPFELPLTGNTVIDFVNQLGYLEPCLTGKTSGSDKPRHPILQMLWGIVTKTNIDHAELLWEEFTQGIQTFFSHKASHKASLKDPKKKSVPLLIPYGRFTKMIIYYVGSTSNVHRRPESPCHLPGDDFLLGNLKFIPKGETDEVFGMAIPKPLITEAI